MLKKLSFSTLGSAFLLLAVSSAAYASDELALAGVKYFTVCVFTAGAAIALSSMVCGFSQALGIRNAVDGIARNPESSGKVTVTLLIGLAMIESLCIYTLVIALIIIYAHPQSEAIAKLFGH